MSAGDRAPVDAGNEIVLRVGDGAACGISINGQTARHLGAAGQARTVHITPQNYREFLQQ
jgi:hypothetical protein